ncbi:MAG TPA: sugar ABC transporter permease [Candidatus Faecousia faecipullorum]|nr:sugar ABC transporter permease [Candidatus Faecousia faecipullorum]
MKISTKKALTGLALVAPILLGCLIFYAAPFLLVVNNAFSWGTGYMKRGVGIQNFRAMLENELFRLAFFNTLRFLLVGLPLLLVIAYGIALMLKSRVEKNRLFKSVLMLPYIMPVVGAVVLVEAVFGRNGLLDFLATSLGLPVQDWLNSSCAFGAVLMLFLWKNTGYGVILLLSGLMAIDEEQYGASRLDGATDWQQFRYITVPQMWYSVYFCAVFSLINAFKCFREIFLLGGAHPHESIYMLQHFINNTFANLNYPKLAVASIFLFLTMTAIFALCYRWVLRKEAFRE